MSDLKKAAQQALEALESLFSGQVDPERGMRCGNSVLALKAALAQQQQQEQEQEPVARVIDDETPEGSTEWIPYSGRQVPVKTGDLLYTHPPRREWRSFSEGALMGLYMDFDRKADKQWTNAEYLLRLMDMVQAALKEKNQ